MSIPCLVAFALSFLPFGTLIEVSLMVIRKISLLLLFLFSVKFYNYNFFFNIHNLASQLKILLFKNIIKIIKPIFDNY